MYKIILLFIGIPFIWACKSNSGSQAPVDLTGNLSIDTTLLKYINNDQLNSDVINVDDELQKIGSVPIEAEKKADSVYISKINEAAIKSIHKKKSCADILEQFETIVNDVIKNKDVGVFKKSGWNKNDPNFQKCLQGDEVFKKTYYELNSKMQSALK